MKGILKAVVALGLCLSVAEAALACVGQIENQMYNLENSSADASGNLQLLDQVVDRKRLDYCDAGRGFIILLREMGSGATSDVRRSFHSVADLSLLGRRANLTEIARASSEIIRAENSAADAANTIQVAEQLTRRNRLAPINVIRAAGLLTVNMGSGSTSDIQGTLTSLAQIAGRGAPIFRLATASLIIIQNENSGSDAKGTIDVAVQLIRRHQVEAEPTLTAAGEFTRILGSGQTTNIRSVLGSIVRISSYERLNPDIFAYDVESLHRLENSAQDSAGNIELISSRVLEGKVDSRRGFNIFERQLRNLGSGQTSQARENFRRITDRRGPR